MVWHSSRQSDGALTPCGRRVGRKKCTAAMHFFGIMRTALLPRQRAAEGLSSTRPNLPCRCAANKMRRCGHLWSAAELDCCGRCCRVPRAQLPLTTFLQQRTHNAVGIGNGKGGMQPPFVAAHLARNPAVLPRKQPASSAATHVVYPRQHGGDHTTTATNTPQLCHGQTPTRPRLQCS